MTFLEVVLAVALLGLLTGTLAMAAGSLAAGRQRQAHRLACSELANALILQFIDDAKAMPGELTPVPYGPDTFRFSLTESHATLTLDPAALSQERFSRTARTLDRLKQVTVRVWPSEESGGAFRFDPSLPHATLTRLVDPLSFSNPDTFNTRLETEAGMIEIFSNLMRAESGQPPPAQNTGKVP